MRSFKNSNSACLRANLKPRFERIDGEKRRDFGKSFSLKQL